MSEEKPKTIEDLDSFSQFFFEMARLVFPHLSGTGVSAGVVVDEKGRVSTRNIRTPLDRPVTKKRKP